jgi:hypothetical protein
VLTAPAPRRRDLDASSIASGATATSAMTMPAPRRAARGSSAPAFVAAGGVPSAGWTASLRGGGGMAARAAAGTAGVKPAPKKVWAGPSPGMPMPGYLAGTRSKSGVPGDPLIPPRPHSAAGMPLATWIAPRPPLIGTAAAAGQSTAPIERSTTQSMLSLSVSKQSMSNSSLPTSSAGGRQPSGKGRAFNFGKWGVAADPICISQSQNLWV